MVQKATEGGRKLEKRHGRREDQGARGCLTPDGDGEARQNRVPVTNWAK